MAIQRPNSSGQGHDPEHANNPFHDEIMSHGYSYSHTTPIVGRDNQVSHHHTYKKFYGNDDHNVGVMKHPVTKVWGWDAHKGGPGRHTTGNSTDSLHTYLSNKNRRLQEVFEMTDEELKSLVADLVLDNDDLVDELAELQEDNEALRTVIVDLAATQDLER